MAGKVFWEDREVLKVNELYVEGYGWITEDEYQRIMYTVDKHPATMPNRITQRNIQYQLKDGKTGQMDIEEREFWKHRTFMSDLRKYYFTFGTSGQFPFYRGWVEVMAPNEHEAAEIFNSHYPPVHENIVNYAFIYSQEDFENTEMYTKGNWDGCHKVLGSKKGVAE